MRVPLFALAFAAAMLLSSLRAQAHHSFWRDLQCGQGSHDQRKNGGSFTPFSPFVLLRRDGGRERDDATMGH